MLCCPPSPQLPSCPQHHLRGIRAHSACLACTHTPPRWVVGPTPSPSAPAHRAGSSPGPSSPSGPLRSGETKAAVSQSGARDLPSLTLGSSGLRQAMPWPHTPLPLTLPAAGPWLLALRLLPSRGHSPGGLQETRAIVQRRRQSQRASKPTSSARGLAHSPARVGHWLRGSLQTPFPGSLTTQPRFSPGLPVSLSDGLKSVDCS